MNDGIGISRINNDNHFSIRSFAWCCPLYTIMLNHSNNMYKHEQIIYNMYLMKIVLFHCNCVSFSKYNINFCFSQRIRNRMIWTRNQIKTRSLSKQEQKFLHRWSSMINLNIIAKEEMKRKKKKTHDFNEA